MKQVLILSVNYNSSESLSSLLESVRTLEVGEVKLLGIILDVSGELEGVELPDNFIVVKIPENRGYAYALNVGLKMGLELGVDYYWILNPDLILGERSLVSLLRVAQDNVTSIIGSSVFSLSNENLDRVPWGIGGFIDSRGQVSMGDCLPKAGESVLECDYVPGCSMFLSSEVLSKISYMPEDYFLYFEETEWCLRAKAKGVDSIIASNSEVWHRVYEGKLEEPFRVYFYNRARKLFLWRNRSYFGIGANFIGDNLRSLFSTGRSVLLAHREMKLTFRAHFYAALDFLLFAFVLSDRRILAKLSRKRIESLLS